jgi:hypothetical protein
MEERCAKKWFIACIASLAVILLAAAAVMIIVDPYFHYHGPLSFLSYNLYEERYINDGISRNFTFDAMITGTSMAQNFKPSEMDELFGTNAVKETFSGAGYQELSENLERALERNPDLKTVLWVVDYNGFLRAYDWAQYDSYPTYLYDDNIWNDLSYLLNKSIFYHGVFSNLGKTLTHSPSTTMDEYSSWERDCGLEYIMLSYDRENVRQAENTTFGQAEYDNVVKTIDSNIVQLVSQYPSVTFYIVYPPYSICYWDALVLKGTLSMQLQAEQTATELLLDCSNVRLYNFFDQYDVICNTDYYSDDGHYNAEVNSMMLHWIAADTGLVTKDNYLERLEQEMDFYSHYDYDSIYEDFNP